MTQEQYKKIADIVCRYEGNITRKRSYQHEISAIKQEIQNLETKRIYTEVLIENIDTENKKLEKEIEEL